MGSIDAGAATPGRAGARAARERCDAREYGACGDATTDDQPALQRLVDALGDAVAADGAPGIHLDADLFDASVADNRIRDNGRQSAPAAFRGGRAVRRADPRRLRYGAGRRVPAGQHRHLSNWER